MTKKNDSQIVDELRILGAKLLKRKIIYGHYVVTLSEEIENRSQTKNYFEMSELWFIFFALLKGSLDLLRIAEFYKLNNATISPYSVVVDEYGYLKVVGEHSIPIQIIQKPAYLAPQFHKTLESNINKQEACLSYSLGKTMISVMMLKDLQNFEQGEIGRLKKLNFMKQWYALKTDMGILWRVIDSLMIQDVSKRVMMRQISAMFGKHEKDILSLNGCTLDKGFCKMQLMKQLLADE